MMHNPRASLGKASARHRQEFILGIINFVFEHLAQWRDEPRPAVDGEGLLNGQLCKTLNDLARAEECNFAFHHEADQGAGRRVDIGAYEYALGARSYSQSRYEDLTVFEAKRLPAPDRPRMREREYVTGETTKSGGVQRFKAGLHGHACSLAAMIGYIQEHDADYFYGKINGWIDELCCHPVDELTWDSSEKISPLQSFANGTARTISHHPRKNGEKLVLHHLWVDMNVQSARSQELTKMAVHPYV
ncbi:hypothetical protein [Desulfovibrio sp.]|uniref:hypothetical protein n=1 Tax=Desulfovibrio sp. TaxID=885 RepID=UPI0025C71680|nr:hypothetical protein [Desulfovibrio sp.]